MGMFVANKVIKLLIEKGHAVKGSKALILGFTFKENCPDIRNTRVVDIYRELRQFGLSVEIHDPWADPEEVMREYRIDINNKIEDDTYDVIILAVAHNEFKKIELTKIKSTPDSIVFDTKGFLTRDAVNGRL